VVVPGGAHTVSFVYRPASAALGAAISALALVIVGVIAWRGGWQGRVKST
jgi:hypothetical protein